MVDKKMQILVRSPNWVGDAVMSLPFLENLCLAQPKAAITVWCKSHLIPIFKAYAKVDVLPYEGILNTLRKRGCFDYDVCILLTNSFSSALAAFLTGISKRIGYATDARRPLLTQALSPPKGVHQIDYFLNLATSLGISPQRYTPILSPLSEGIREKQALLGRFKWAVPYIVFAPGAAYGAAKCWPAAYYAKLAQMLVEELKINILILGGKNDQSIAKAILNQVQVTGVYDLTGYTTLAGAMAIIKDALLVISNDSGLMHLTAALNRPQIAIFGPTDPERTSPYGNRTQIIYRRVPCAPCKHRVCPNKHRCMTQIKPQEVVEVIRSLGLR